MVEPLVQSKKQTAEEGETILGEAWSESEGELKIRDGQCV